MAEQPDTQFGTRKPAAIRPAQPVKRGQVALLLMGTLAVGGGAYAMMPSEHCDPNRPGVAASGLQTNAECRSRGSSSGSHSSSGGTSSRSGFLSGNSSSNSSTGTPSDAGSGHVTRGGFGSFASHFSGGG